MQVPRKWWNHIRGRSGNISHLLQFQSLEKSRGDVDRCVVVSVYLHGWVTEWVCGHRPLSRLWHNMLGGWTKGGRLPLCALGPVFFLSAPACWDDLRPSWSRQPQEEDVHTVTVVHTLLSNTKSTCGDWGHLLDAPRYYSSGDGSTRPVFKLLRPTPLTACSLTVLQSFSVGEVKPGEAAVASRRVMHRSVPPIDGVHSESASSPPLLTVCPVPGQQQLQTCGGGKHFVEACAFCCCCFLELLQTGDHRSLQVSCKVGHTSTTHSLRDM